MTRFLLTLLLTPLLSVKADYDARTVAEGLNFPWSMTFADAQTLLVATRSGTIQRISLETSDQTALSGAPETYVESQGGY
ncbi:MAG: PQQ-dependent sugar dehydrogenase, partial [Pseudomonadales bacterium]